MKLSDETRRKMREAKLRFYKNHPNFNKGKNHPNYGKHRTFDKSFYKTLEYRTKISESLKGRKHREKTKKIISEKAKERYQKDLTLNKGRRNPRYGKHWSEEWKQKQREIMKRKSIGERNPNWQGGKSFEPYSPDFNKRTKETLRVFYGNVCFLCNKVQNGQKLDVHHINYDKQNCNFENLVPLCHSCNSKVNFNRNFWTKELRKGVEEYAPTICYRKL